MNGWRIAAAGLVALAVVTPLQGAAGDAAVSGEAIYLRGVLSSGAPLEGKRDAAGRDAQGANAQGAQAA
jgi:hypothetical protein